MLARLKRHGITADIYNDMLKQQKGVCAICSSQLREGYGTHVDHCHGTGIVRGLLCHKCNNGIGWLEKNLNLLDAALDYINPNPQQKIIGKK